MAATGSSVLNLTSHPIGYAAVAIFALAYLLVMAEEFTGLRKSKPVILAAGLIWAMIAWVYAADGLTHQVEGAIQRSLLEYAELMLFLLVAMTYVNAMHERRVFDALRAWLQGRGLGLRKLFWLTGGLAFCISPLADNLTTALLMCAVVMAVGNDNPRFISLACINIVVAANAGGAFSPFGDITTLMVWQRGVVEFDTFFVLFVPALVNFLVPASLMHFAVPDTPPQIIDDEVTMKRGARRIIGLFLLTIVTAVSFHNLLDIPPVIGMLTGLAYLQFMGFYLQKTAHKDHSGRRNNHVHASQVGEVVTFDVFERVARAEWDTLLFFYGVVMCVG
ncbi:MAG TPA: sodium:proton antiporter NhaD, partial [Thiohalobacter sp.]|nr:sodium:proton antiporter NhaD [Thiohalobacter sp.]